MNNINESYEFRIPQRYSSVEDLAIITSYFNPRSFKTKFDNFARFSRPILSGGLFLLTVELAFDGQGFTIAEETGGTVLQVKARDVLWQKERLINIGIASLPSRFTKVAWLDCDLLFSNSEWVVTTSRLLDRCDLVQPFDSVQNLPSDGTVPTSDANATDSQTSWWHSEMSSFAATFCKSPFVHLEGLFARHGHTGYAWAAKRDLLTNIGLYDRCIVGGGDHLMAHAACGDWESRCIDKTFCGNDKHSNDFKKWAKEFYAQVGGRICCIPGCVMHLWHGDLANRKYIDRNLALSTFGFDPLVDIVHSSSGAWAWASDKPQLHSWVSNYFAMRMEDNTLLHAKEIRG